ncbi:MAG: Sec-independent protein translocase protein TatB [Gammaproteobacteria bacterium]|nr:Sec-independent protein translocase protein TatB [Gammaproteobacteria bacterium]
MFDIGFWELFLIAVVALVVVGPERLPKLVRVTGLWVGRANASFQSIRSEISRELRAEELKQALNKTVDLDELSMESDSIESQANKNKPPENSPEQSIDSSDPIEKDNDNR